MKKPTKKELLGMLGQVASKLNEHQKEDSKIMAGYTLAANINEGTELLNNITNLLVKSLN